MGHTKIILLRFSFRNKKKETFSLCVRIQMMFFHVKQMDFKALNNAEWNFICFELGMRLLKNFNSHTSKLVRCHNLCCCFFSPFFSFFHFNMKVMEWSDRKGADHEWLMMKNITDFYKDVIGKVSCLYGTFGRWKKFSWKWQQWSRNPRKRKHKRKQTFLSHQPSKSIVRRMLFYSLPTNGFWSVSSLRP